MARKLGSGTKDTLRDLKTALDRRLELLGDEVSRWNLRRRDQRTVGERDAQQWSLRGADKLPMLAANNVQKPIRGFGRRAGLPA